MDLQDNRVDSLIEDLKARYLKMEPGQFPLRKEYGGPENPELDDPFTTTELLTAIDVSNTKSAPGTDAITYKLLNNISDAARAELLDHINLAWERSELPAEWMEAEVRFIPKPGKPLTIENMRPISLTSCVGKVVERMVLR